MHVSGLQTQNCFPGTSLVIDFECHDGTCTCAVLSYSSEPTNLSPAPIVYILILNQLILLPRNKNHFWVMTVSCMSSFYELEMTTGQPVIHPYPFLHKMEEFSITHLKLKRKLVVRIFGHILDVGVKVI